MFKMIITKKERWEMGSLGEDEKMGRKKESGDLSIVFGHFLKRAMDPFSSFVHKIKSNLI